MRVYEFSGVLSKAYRKSKDGETEVSYVISVPRVMAKLIPKDKRFTVRVMVEEEEEDVIEIIEDEEEASTRS